MEFNGFPKTTALTGVHGKALVDIDNLVRKGEKLKAIGVYREATGADLSEAKAAIEAYMKDNGVEVSVPSAPKKKGWFK